MECIALHAATQGDLASDTETGACSSRMITYLGMTPTIPPTLPLMGKTTRMVMIAASNITTTTQILTLPLTVKQHRVQLERQYKTLATYSRIQ